MTENLNTVEMKVAIDAYMNYETSPGSRRLITGHGVPGRARDLRDICVEQ